MHAAAARGRSGSQRSLLDVALTPVTPDGAKPLSPLEKVRLAGEIGATYLLAFVAMRAVEIRDAVSRLRRCGATTRAVDVDPVTAGIRLADAVSRTLAVMPTDRRCLIRSLVLVRLLARRGIPSALVIGTRTAPRFGAHAWVEYDGTPLLPPGGPEIRRLTEL